MVKFFEGLPLFPSRCVLTPLAIALEYCAPAHASAQLIRLADLVQIVLPTRITEYVARRFAIVHELYHFLKRHPSLSPTMLCKPKWLRGTTRDLHAFERGANAFGGAVLLPEFLLRKRCEVSPVSLDVPWQIAKEYDVSI